MTPKQFGPALALPPVTMLSVSVVTVPLVELMPMFPPSPAVV